MDCGTFSELKALMEEEVYSHFVVWYHGIVYGRLAHRGHGGELPTHVTIIKSWYDDNQDKMDGWMRDFKNRNSSHGVMWQEFKEMFVDGDNLAVVTELAQSMADVTFASLILRSNGLQTYNLYLLWKSQTQQRHRDQDVHQATYTSGGRSYSFDVAKDSNTLIDMVGTFFNSDRRS